MARLYPDLPSAASPGGEGWGLESGAVRAVTGRPSVLTEEAMDKFPMTPRGAEMLRAELARLKEERPRISKEIEVAREHGDLSENAEYHAAKERQGLNEARIRDVEG